MKNYKNSSYVLLRWRHRVIIYYHIKNIARMDIMEETIIFNLFVPFSQWSVPVINMIITPVSCFCSKFIYNNIKICMVIK